MSIQEAYTNWSTTYDSDRNLTRDLDEAVTRDTLGHLTYDSILEIGCGTGKNTNLLGDIGGRVCALDFSIGMLGRARAKLSSGRVSFAVADLTQPWPCQDASFELIVCCLVLEHIEDLSRTFSEAVRVLAPRGHLFVCELHPFRQYQGTQAHFQRGPETIEIPAFVHHLSEFTDAATRNGLSLLSFKEWWHDADHKTPPRLVSFMFGKSISV